MHKRAKSPNRGIILLVVLTTLTFFSILLAAYLVFSNQSRESSFAIASRNINRPDPNAILDQALMTLIRGTTDENNPFFGEDLLSDFYGRRDATQLTTSLAGVDIGTGTPNGPVGMARFALNPSTLPASFANPLSLPFDDVLTGRIVTFQDAGVPHPLVERSYRVLRSVFDATSVPRRHSIVLDVGSDVDPTRVPPGQTLWLNGLPRNSPGIGFNGSDVSLTAPVQVTPSGGIAFPAALQPNHIGRSVDKSILTTSGGDFDESYDAADHNNWFLSFRREDGTVIPSFHRPSVLNYILNNPAFAPGTDGVISFARGTFRPIPLHGSHVGGNAIHERFTGGNPNFALRAPIQMASPERFDQLARALIQGPWDVDNDADGQPDSVWVDLDLPFITAGDGRLLKPLIAPMIEDLSGKLNVNAHGNYALIGLESGLEATVGSWAGTPASPVPMYRGLGSGPAEVSFPIVDASATPAQRAAFAQAYTELLAARYRSGNTFDVSPGAIGFDGLGLIVNGRRPQLFELNTFYGSSLDPYGRGGYAIASAGGIGRVNVGIALTDNPATSIVEPNANELSDNPYELDPTGGSAADSPFTLVEFEQWLRQYNFDSSLDNSRLVRLAEPLVTLNPLLRSAITVISKSDDRPAALNPQAANSYFSISQAIFGAPPADDIQLKRLVAPELRLGAKMDLNRRFGNGVDDSPQWKSNGVDDDGDGTTDEFDERSPGEDVIDEPGELASDLLAYRTQVPTVPPISPPYDSAVPSYNFDNVGATDSRQLFARHLYVLMMTISDSLATNFPTFGETLGISVADPVRYRARRLAQWAVNVVDYRDPDSVMTAFEYDEVITNGWDVDGNLMTNEGIGTGVVWGVEQPELLFSESLALHDVRVRDTDLDASGSEKGAMPTDDADTDQMRIPQGSLFLELYCPRESIASTDTEPGAAGIPRDLYTIASTAPLVDYGLDLDRTVTTRFNGTTYGIGQSYETPVWRIAITVPHVIGGGLDVESPLQKRLTSPDTLTFQPNSYDQLDIRNTATSPIALERFVLFQNFGTPAVLGPPATPGTLLNAITPIPDMVAQPSAVFFNRTTVNPLLRPEQYLTLAPRLTTSLGSEVYPVAGAGPIKPSDQRFVVNASGITQFDQAGTTLTPAVGTNIRQGLGLVIAGLPPAGAPWVLADQVGMNISEPLASNVPAYYTKPTFRYTTAVPDYPVFDSYVELDAGGLPVGAGVPLDTPEDLRVAGPIAALSTADDPQLGTFDNYRTAYLQRLADPTRGFDPTLNPYLTVDQIAIDLTIFSGEETEVRVAAPGSGGVPNPATDYATQSRERNGSVGGTPINALLSYETTAPVDSPIALPGISYFAFAGAQTHIRTTLNYLNTGFGVPQPVPNLGRPATPFANHPWLNRDFASPMEVLMVPACSAGRLMEEFTTAGVTGVNPQVFVAPTDAPGSVDYARTFNSPFRHLLNFFHATSPKHASPDAAEFSLLFDFVTASTGFRGEEEVISPNRLVGPLAQLYAPPMSKVPTHTRNGRINLNTLNNFAVWAGLMGGHLESTEFTNPIIGTQLGYDSFLTSRRGYIPPGGTASRLGGTAPYNYAPTYFDPALPTEFAGVFEQAVNARHEIALQDLAATTMLNETELLRRRTIDAGVLRAAGDLVVQDPATVGAVILPQFVRDAAAAPTAAHMDRNANALLRYQTAMRMPNLVSDNSQVFAVWLTLGLFEVDATNTDNLGAEYGESTGESQRYKALFIIDRSIPVGFVPGQDLNARDTVIFERFYQ